MDRNDGTGKSGLPGRNKRFWLDRRGMVVIWAAMWILAAMGVSAIVIDLGRLFVVREQVQTAVDAGSLAASLHGIRYVKVKVPDRWKWECDVCTCCDDEGGCWPCCCNCQTYVLPDAFPEGKRTYTWDQAGWYEQAGCGSCGMCCYVGCGEPKVVEQWIYYPADTSTEAVNVASMNLPSEVKAEQGGSATILPPEIHTGVAEEQSEYATHVDPLAPSVIMRVKGTVKSLLSSALFGETSLPVDRCGQSGSFFIKMDERGGDTGKYNKKPEPG